jgi:hypothetical protein
MVETVHDSGSRDERVNAILAAYLDAAAAGQAPDQAELLARHPDLAAELAAFFAEDAQVRHLAETATLARDEPAPRPSLGTVRYFGDYELVEEIARGGMGVVYKARQASLNRVVALKMILSGQLASPSEVRRFQIEAESAANLDHPNIVPIYEVGEHQGLHYFSMKLVEGGSLAAALARGLLRTTDKQGRRAAASLVARLARAVHYAHQRGILHRDLKPANILLQESGVRGQESGNRTHPWRDSCLLTPDSLTPVITDFGLSKRLEGDVKLSQSGAIVGTPAYMAPEQAAGRRDLTTAVDVYSLGAILYELLTGTPPFTGGAPMDVILQVMDREPVPPRQLQPAIDRDLETICLRSMAREPAKRYGTAAALAEDLERWQRGEPILARPVGSWERAVKWVQRQRTVAGLWGLSALVTLIAVGQLLGAGTALVLAALWVLWLGLALLLLRRQAVSRAAAMGEANEPIGTWFARAWRHPVRAYKELPFSKPINFSVLLFVIGALAARVQDLVGWPMGPGTGSIAGGVFAGVAVVFVLWLCFGPRRGAMRRSVRRLQRRRFRAFLKAPRHIRERLAKYQLALAKSSLARMGQELVQPSFARLFAGAGIGFLLACVATNHLHDMGFIQTGTHLLIGVVGATFGVLVVAVAQAYRTAWLPGLAVLAGALALFRATLITMSMHWLSEVALEIGMASVAIGLAAFVILLGALGLQHLGKRILGERSSSWVTVPVTITVLICALIDTLCLAAILLTSLFGTAALIATLSGQVGQGLDGRLGLVVGETVGDLVWGPVVACYVWLLFGGLLQRPTPQLSPRAARWFILLFVAPAPVGYGGIWWMLHADGPQGTLVRQVHSDNMDIVAAPGGQPLWLRSKDGHVQIGDWTGDKPLEFNALPRDHYTCAVLSPDGRRLLSGSAKGSVRLWEAESGAELARCEGHRNPVTCVAFSPDGRRAVSGSRDWTVRVWDLDRGSPLCVCRGHKNAVTNVAFSADGTMVVSRGDDGTTCTWQIPE